jgi:hypothetical protein
MRRSAACSLDARRERVVVDNRSRAMSDLFSLQDLLVAGLGFDIAGAWLLAHGLLGSTREMAKLSGTYWGVNRAEQLRLARDKVDASFGLMALLVGFGLQVIAYALTLAIETDADYGLGRATVAVGLATGTGGLTYVAWRVSRVRFQRRLLLRLAHLDTEQTEHELPDGATLTMFGQLLGEEQREGESHEEYARRVWKVERITKFD